MILPNDNLAIGECFWIINLDLVQYFNINLGVHFEIRCDSFLRFFFLEF